MAVTPVACSDCERRTINHYCGTCRECHEKRVAREARESSIKLPRGALRADGRRTGCVVREEEWD